MQVLNEMRPGLDEKLYERALVIDLRRHGHTIESQKKFPVLYQSQIASLEDGNALCGSKSRLPMLLISMLKSALSAASA